MPSSKELSSYYKRTLLMLKRANEHSPSSVLRRYILDIETEMDAEDVAYVNEKLRQETDLE